MALERLQRFIDKARLEYAWLCLQDWFETADILFGWGPGRAAIEGARIQIKHNFHMQALMYWTHNDWLQILLEYGIVGLGLSLWSYVYLLKCAGFNTRVFWALVIFGGAMTVQMPLRHPVGVLILCTLAVQAFSSRKSTSNLL